jgi:hypothetical protein
MDRISHCRSILSDVCDRFETFARHTYHTLPQYTFVGVCNGGHTLFTGRCECVSKDSESSDPIKNIQHEVKNNGDNAPKVQQSCECDDDKTLMQLIYVQQLLIAKLMKKML